jgi:uncharacterized circularly permuted ATP-grasp superfamily protein
VVTLSTVPTLVNDRLEPRHVDLRPFILSGRETNVTTGRSTRVALRKGSLVVNFAGRRQQGHLGSWTRRTRCSRAS